MIRTPLASLIGFAAALLVVLSCTAVPTRQEGKGTPVSFGPVPVRPGAVAWARDSERFAVIEGSSLRIHDLLTEQSRTVPEILPLFVSWAPADDIRVIGRSPAGETRMYVIAGNGTLAGEESLDPEARGVWWVPAVEEAVVLSAREKRTSIGIFASYRYQWAGETSVLMEADAYFPTRRTDLDVVSGWIYSPLRPVFETLLLPEFHDPPALEPYVKFRSFDPLTRESAELLRMPTRKTTVHASWSPDGSRLAVVDDGGYLTLIPLRDPRPQEPVTRELQVEGGLPAWNPAGSLIYMGGWLVGSDGQLVERLLTRGESTMGIWSPDGSRLLIATAGDLLLFEGFSPSFVAPDRPFDQELRSVRDRLRILKDLYRDELILREEYLERSARVLADHGLMP